MTENITEKRNALAASHLITALASRNMEGHYAANREEALKIALSLIPEGSAVGWGGGMSLDEIGLITAIRQGGFAVFDRETAKDPAQRRAVMKQALTADVFLMGTNAITEDGQLVNLDGVGNRVAALCFGPEKVIVIAGMNKLCPDLETAVDRVRHTAAPINAQRFAGVSPCRQNGMCGNCRGDSCICCDLVITRNSMVKDRIHVILVNDALGF